MERPKQTIIHQRARNTLKKVATDPKVNQNDRHLKLLKRLNPEISEYDRHLMNKSLNIFGGLATWQPSLILTRQ